MKLQMRYSVKYYDDVCVIVKFSQIGINSRLTEQTTSAQHLKYLEYIDLFSYLLSDIIHDKITFFFFKILTYSLTNCSVLKSSYILFS